MNFSTIGSFRLSRAAAVLCAAIIAWCATAPAEAASILSSWNLIVRTDAFSSSEVDGSALIGGNLKGTSNYAIHGVTAPNNVALAVGGSLGPGNYQLNNGGRFQHDGPGTGPGINVNYNGGGSLLNDPNVGALVTNVFNQLESISTQLSALTPNGSIDGAGNWNATPVVIDGKKVAIYNITPANYTGGQWNLNMGTADSVIINAVGLSFNFSAPPNMIGGFNQSNSSKILWNFVNATSISSNNTFNGAILAPFADLKLIGGGMNGTVAVNKLSQQHAEIRRFTYQGFAPPPVPVPEPASLALAGLGLASVGLLVARKAKRSAK